MTEEKGIQEIDVAGAPNGGELVSMESDHLLEIARSAEKRIEAIKKIKTIVLKLTSNYDWTDQGGRPYLTASGCHKVARIFGISWSFVEDPKREFEEDGHYRYEVRLSVSMKGQSIEVIGSRSSRDPFFTTRYKDGKKITLPPSEIDAGDILKAAITNAQAIGITALLGVRNITWEELEEVGIRRDNVSSVEYTRPEMSSEAKDKRDKIRKMVLEMAGGDENIAKDLLQEISSFTDKQGRTIKGKRTINALSEKQIPIVYGKVKERYEEWKSERPDLEGDLDADESGQQTIK